MTGLGQQRSSAHVYSHNPAKCRARATNTDSSDKATQTTTPASNVAVLDKLIAVFSSKSPTEWRKLIAHSKQWPQLSASVLARYVINPEGDACAILTSAVVSLRTIIDFDSSPSPVQSPQVRAADVQNT